MKTRDQRPPMDRLTSATREELDVALQLIDGQLPDDLHGHVFINSSAGSVNSGGLPYREYTPSGERNPEFGTPIFNGDGYFIRLDFDQPSQVSLRTRLLKTPSFWADHALREGGPASQDPRYDGWDWKFHTLGLARLSLQLGQANQLNVAAVPVQFKENEPPRLLATFEAGSPWEVDPASLEVKAPMLKTSDTLSMTPEWMWRYPFKCSLTTAHPVYDGRTRELFIVNYTKSMKTLVGFQRILLSSFRSPEKTRRRVLEAIEKARAKGGEEGLREFERFVEEDTHLLEGRKIPDFREAFDNFNDRMRFTDALFLLRYNGNTINEKWRVRCEGKDITICDNMHQMGITENYVILADSSFKMNLSLMYNHLRPQYPELDEMLRDLLTRPMNPFSTLYFVKRSDLTADRQSVEAVKAIVPLECVHFSANYKEENGLITINTANNTASCPAEWMRHFDKVKRTGEPMNKEHLGFLNDGPMDIGRVGRFVFDPQTGGRVEERSNVLFETGNLGGEGPIGQHTWAVGLYTYRGYEEVTPRPEKVQNIYWQMSGLDRDLFTEFIYELYCEYPHREVSLEDMERLSKTGVPMGLARVDHSAEKLKVNDYYLFAPKHNMRSIQFVPRRTRNEVLPEDMDGYILGTMVVPVNLDKGTYRSEVWLWDAARLADGPICKLHHPRFKFAYTFHSVWAATAGPTNPENQIDVIDDIDDQVLAIGNPVRQVKLENFLEEYVYPHFAHQQNAVADPDPKDYSGKVYKWMLRTAGLRKRRMRFTGRSI